MLLAIGMSENSDIKSLTGVMLDKGLQQQGNRF